jgi:AbrB family looped-hinge helix DNA binding protein
MAVTAVLSSKFQISIPKSICDAQQWKAGQKFVFVPKAKGVLLIPAPKLSQLAGVAKGANPATFRDRQDRY